MAASVLWLWACARTNEPFSLTSCACSSACATGTPRALTAQTASVTMYERVIWDLLGLRPQDATGWREEGPTAAEIHLVPDRRSGRPAREIHLGPDRRSAGGAREPRRRPRAGASRGLRRGERARS